MSYNDGIDSFLDDVDPIELLLNSYYPNSDLLDIANLILEQLQLKNYKEYHEVIDEIQEQLKGLSNGFLLLERIERDKK